MSFTRSFLSIALSASVVVTAMAPVHAIAGKDARIQSSARPLGLDIVAPVQRRGSDASAKAFLQSQDYRDFQSMLNGDLTQSFDEANYSTMLLDPSKITLQNDYQARAYFVQDDAGFHNSFGFTSTSSGVTSDRQLIFPDASTGSRRTQSTPLKAGDFVELGDITGGTKLDFFLIADGAQGGTNVFSTTTAANPDGVRHAMSHAFVSKDSPYLLLAFEDLFGGGDEDYNDLVVALDIGQGNVKNIIKTVGAPEPASIVSVATCLVAGVTANRRRKRKLQLEKNARTDA